MGHNRRLIFSFLLLTSLTGACARQGPTGIEGPSGPAGVTGPTGSNGLNGNTPQYVPVIAITPCGPNSSAFKEALLGLEGGSIFAEVIGTSGDANTIRNSLLPDGSYSDTDSSECNFTVSTDASGDRTIAWDGSSANNSGPYPSGQAVYQASTEIWSATY